MASIADHCMAEKPGSVSRLPTLGGEGRSARGVASFVLLSRKRMPPSASRILRMPPAWRERIPFWGVRRGYLSRAGSRAGKANGGFR